MNNKVLHTLEFDKILAELSQYAASQPAKKMCERLRPSQDAEWIQKAQSQTEDAIQRLLKDDRISFSANTDLRELLRSASLGHMLDIPELLSVCRLLEGMQQISKYSELTSPEETDTLTELFDGLDPLPSVAKEISRCILTEDSLSDDASSELKSIRREQSVINGRIHQHLTHMVNQTHRSYLQDAVITLRGDRYCIPVKAEYKSQVPGIVHDQSSSGSTFFIEPVAVVEMNNRLRELHLREEEEIRRILLALSGLCGQNADIINEGQKYMTLLDFIFAKAKYALQIKATRPVYEEGHHIRLRKARHPLLPADSAVPIDISLGYDYDMLIVTGPNTGGKTVSLKTVGLLTLMGQAGLHIPALDRSVLSLFHEVYADIGDEQSIEQSLSTFSSHMTSIVSILRKANENSLCLFDELGAGTDPTEGAALANAILDTLHRKKIRTMATTHYSELKLYALSTAGVENASCEFNVDTLSPTYRLLTGIPGKSNAFAISRKLGLPEDIITIAGGYLSQESSRFEDVISDLEARRLHMDEQEESLRERLQKLEAKESSLEEREEKLKSQQETILLDAREEARELLKEAKEIADQTIRSFTTQGDQMKITTMEKKRQNLREWISKQDEAIYQEAMRQSATRKKKEESKPVSRLTADNAKPGVAVHSSSLGMDGVIISGPDKSGKVKIQCGVFTTKCRLNELTLSDAPPEDNTQSTVRYSSLNKSAVVSAEINLIGCTVDEALPRLDKYLDDVSLSSLERVRIVHGKGSGALKNGVHNYLKTHPAVKSFSLAEHGEGDAGVTIVIMK